MFVSVGSDPGPHREESADEMEHEDDGGGGHDADDEDEEYDDANENIEGEAEIIVGKYNKQYYGAPTINYFKAALSNSGL